MATTSALEHAPVRALAPGRQWYGGMVRVFERDAALLAGMPPEPAAAARAQAVAPTLVVDRGPWTPPAGPRCERMLGLLVLDGLLVRGIELGGARSPELLGEGDVLRPWDDPTDQADLGATSSWRAISPVTLAVLDARFIEVIRRWPWLSQALLSRSLQRSRSLAFRLTIPQIRRADDRLRMLFRDLAARWGKVTPDGIVVPLPLTNQLIAELVCLRRQTASSTMTRLAHSREIVRHPGGGFLVDLACARQPAAASASA